MMLIPTECSSSSAPIGTKAHLLCSPCILDFCLEFYVGKKKVLDDLIRRWNFQISFEHILYYMWEINGYCSQVHILVNSKPTLNLPKVLSSFLHSSSLCALEDLSSKNARRAFCSLHHNYVYEIYRVVWDMEIMNSSIIINRWYS